LSIGKVSVWYPCAQNVEKTVSKGCFELNKSKQTDLKIEAALFPSFLSSFLSIRLMFVVVPNALAPFACSTFHLKKTRFLPFSPTSSKPQPSTASNPTFLFCFGTQTLRALAGLIQICFLRFRKSSPSVGLLFPHSPLETELSRSCWKFHTVPASSRVSRYDALNSLSTLAFKSQNLRAGTPISTPLKFTR
jgi:hypothetical protein